MENGTEIMDGGERSWRSPMETMAYRVGWKWQLIGGGSRLFFWDYGKDDSVGSRLLRGGDNLIWEIGCLVDS